MRIKTVIVDDELKSIMLLEKYLEAYTGDLKIVGKAQTSEEGFKLIKEVEPNLIFLDISMPGGTGFDLIDRFAKRNFDVIFLTAHADYAVDAFKRYAIHYLLKPVDLNELDEAIHRVIEKQSGNTDWNKEELRKKEKITIPTQTGYQVVRISEIIRCEADGAYTKVVLTDGSKLMVSQNLKTFEIQLISHGFMRVHRSHLISLMKVESFTRGKNSLITMADGMEVYVSSNKKNEFFNYMKGSSISEL